MDDFVAWSRGLMAIGIALLLVMLRLESERFGTAEYYEATRDGERPRVRRRLAWYGIGVALVVGLYLLHPEPATVLFLGSGDRLGAVLGGVAYGMAGVGLAVAFATLRYHRIRFPDTSSYPGALLNSVATALIDEAAFRGAIFGLLLTTGLDPTVSNLVQAILYTLATRLGAPGRDRYLLGLALAMGLVGGWLTAVTGGIAAAFLGHAIARFAVFLCTGHAGQTKPRGRETEEIEQRRRVPDGWSVIGTRESATREQ